MARRGSGAFEFTPEEMKTAMASRALLIRTARLLAAGVLIWLAVRSILKDWDPHVFTEMLSQSSMGWLCVAGIVVAITYFFTIESWKRAMTDQGARLSRWQAMRIVSLANLGKYAPG